MRQKVILKGRSAGIMRSVMNAIIPAGGPFRAGASDYDLIPRANEVLRSYNPAIAGAFPLILLYVQLSTLSPHRKVLYFPGPGACGTFSRRNGTQPLLLPSHDGADPETHHLPCFLRN